MGDYLSDMGFSPVAFGDFPDATAPGRARMLEAGQMFARQMAAQHARAEQERLYSSPFVQDLVQSLMAPPLNRDESGMFPLAPGAGESFVNLKARTGLGGGAASLPPQLPPESGFAPAPPTGPVNVDVGMPTITGRTPAGPDWTPGRGGDPTVIRIKGANWVAPQEQPQPEPYLSRGSNAMRPPALVDQPSNRPSKRTGPKSPEEIALFEKMAPYIAQRRQAEINAAAGYNRSNLEGTYKAREAELKSATRLLMKANDSMLELMKLEQKKNELRAKQALGADDLKWVQKGLVTAQQAHRSAQDAIAAQEQLGGRGFPPGSAEREAYDRALSQGEQAQGAYVEWANLYASKVGRRVSAALPQMR